MNAIVSNVDPALIRSEIYPAGGRTTFVAVLTTVGRVRWAKSLPVHIEVNDIDHRPCHGAGRYGDTRE